MRHRKAGRSLRRTSEQRLALLRNLATSLIESGAIETTEAKAKELSFASKSRWTCLTKTSKRLAELNDTSTPRTDVPCNMVIDDG
jgi:large subunit ribosomal protein L17